MNNETRERYLKLALVVFGVVFWLIYPLGLVWPAGWVWHGGEGTYYLQMICGIYAVLGIFLIAAARNPAENRSLSAVGTKRTFALVASTSASDPKGTLTYLIELALGAVAWPMSH